MSLFAILLLAGDASPQELVFKADARLVLVDVQVVEKVTGRVISDLVAPDFEVLDDGARQDLKLCVYEDTPLDLVALHHISGTAEIEAYSHLVNGARFGLAELRSKDAIAVMRFASRRNLLLDFTNDPHAALVALFSGLRNVHSGGGRRLYDGVVSASELLMGQGRRTLRRRAILVITDDKELHSKATLDGTIEAALEADATVIELELITGEKYANIGIGIPIPRAPRTIYQGRAPNSEPRWNSIRPVVEATGGEVVRQDVDGYRLRELLERLRTRYLLGYYAPPATGRTFHSITVRLTDRARMGRPEITIRSRKGYYSQP